MRTNPRHRSVAMLAVAAVTAVAARRVAANWRKGHAEHEATLERLRQENLIMNESAEAAKETIAEFEFRNAAIDAAFAVHNDPIRWANESADALEEFQDAMRRRRRATNEMIDGLRATAS